jgi:hypothetical protein
MRITSRLLAWAIVPLLLLAGPSLANTVDIVSDGFGAYDAVTVWGGGSYGDGAEAGVYTLNKTGDSGIGSTWHNGPVSGFCVELNEMAPTEMLRYAVGMPDDMIVSYTGNTLGTTKSNYLRELWARYYDPAWAQSVSGTTTTARRRSRRPSGRSFTSAPGSPGAVGRTADGTLARRLLPKRTPPANRWLQAATRRPEATCGSS